MGRGRETILLMKPIEESPLYRRVRLHGRRRLGKDAYIEPAAYMKDLQEFLRLEREMLMRYHEKRDPGWKVCQSYAIMIDVLLTFLFDNAVMGWLDTHKDLPMNFAIVANGGYGRGELCPHSDIDFTLLYGGRLLSKAAGEEFKEWITRNVLYPLWDMKFKVGHASRTIKESVEAAKEDIQTKTSLMQSRLVCGDGRLAKDFLEKYAEFLGKSNSEEYLVARRRDQQERRKKYLDTVFVQEPDIKNGVGGLRDVQNIVWMAIVKFGYQNLREIRKAKLLQKGEYRELVDAYDFLLSVRNELHFQNQRPTDILTLDKQPEVALSLGYTHKNIVKRVEFFMRDYYTHARNVFNLSNALEKHFLIPERGGKGNGFFRYHRLDGGDGIEKVDAFIAKDGELDFDEEDIFERDPVQLVRVFRIAQKNNLAFGARLVRKIQESKNLLTPNHGADDRACRAFRAMLQEAGHVYPILSQMHDLGVLGRFIQEFEGLTCLVQHEYYHRYTADFHTLETIRYLDMVFMRKDARHQKFYDRLHHTNTPALLYLILLLHDVGKSKGIKGHAETGVWMSQSILDRLGVPMPQQKLVLFIVEHHLAMSRFAQKHDVEDPGTCQIFADFIKDADLLAYLYVHTYCDTQGTAPDLWSGFKESLLDTLYEQTRRLLQEHGALHDFAAEQQESIREEIRQWGDLGMQRDIVDGHFETLPPRYFMNLTADDVALHLRKIQEFLEHVQRREGPELLMPVIHWEEDVEKGFSIVTVVTWDRPGLFYRLAGAFTLAGLNILGTRAFSRADDITIDTFNVVDANGGPVTDSSVKDKFLVEVRRTLVDLERMLPRIEDKEMNPKQSLVGMRKKVLLVPVHPKVVVAREHTLDVVIVEVQAKDSFGLLYRLARAISHADMDIVFVRLVTENSVAMDTFHLIRKEGTMVITEGEMKDLQVVLEEIVKGQEGEEVLSGEEDADALIGEGI
jgi:[protein-PII] uridylyltransferase